MLTLGGEGCDAAGLAIRRQGVQQHTRACSRRPQRLEDGFDEVRERDAVANQRGSASQSRSTDDMQTKRLKCQPGQHDGEQQPINVMRRDHWPINSAIRLPDNAIHMAAATDSAKNAKNRAS